MRKILLWKDKLVDGKLMEPKNTEQFRIYGGIREKSKFPDYQNVMCNLKCKFWVENYISKQYRDIPIQIFIFKVQMFTFSGLYILHMTSSTGIEPQTLISGPTPKSSATRIY